MDSHQHAEHDLGSGIVEEDEHDLRSDIPEEDEHVLCDLVQTDLSCNLTDKQ